MNKIAIIIPSRLDAQRFPNKPLKLINNKEMILHVYEAAYKIEGLEVAATNASADSAEVKVAAVSYTHLTLPTIYSV